MARINEKNQKGFTLVELLLSISIIIIGLFMIVEVEFSAKASFDVASNKFQAVFLAQEGVEIIKNIRSYNWLNYEANWNEGLEDTTVDDNVDCVTTGLFNSDNRLYLNASNQFVHGGGTSTLFSRHIEIAYLEDGDGITYMQVKSIVDWSERGKNYSVIIEDHLYDWK